MNRELPDYAPEILPVLVACQRREVGRKVALLKCTEEEDLRAETRKVIALLGGMQAVVRKGDRVFVKVNGTMAKPRDTGAVVDAQVLWAVVEEAFAAGASEVAIGDAAVLDQGSTIPVFAQLGYDDVAQATGATLLDLNLPPFARVAVPGGGMAYRSLLVREELRSFDVVLNVPKLKTHACTGVTLGLKNMFGMTPMNPIMGFTKASFHGEVPENELVRSTPKGQSAREYAGEFLKGRPPGQSNDKLIRAIADHNLVFPSSLVVIDGVIGMEGKGPWSGDPIRSNVLVAGYDLVATDAVAAQLMGYVAQEMPIFRRAIQAGLGDADLESIELVGDAIEDVSTAFKRHPAYEAWAEEWNKENERVLA
jgi:uncharacterized protein (DUF362 family)